MTTSSKSHSNNVSVCCSYGVRGVYVFPTFFIYLCRWSCAVFALKQELLRQTWTHSKKRQYNLDHYIPFAKKLVCLFSSRNNNLFLYSTRDGDDFLVSPGWRWGLFSFQLGNSKYKYGVIQLHASLCIACTCLPWTTPNNRFSLPFSSLPSAATDAHYGKLRDLVCR